SSSSAGPPAQLIKMRTPGYSLLAVSRAELLEALWFVVAPLAQLGAGCQLARPVIQSGLLARDSAGPDPVDQHPIAIAALARVVYTLCFDAHLRSRMASMSSHLPIFDRPGMPARLATSYSCCRLRFSSACPGSPPRWRPRLACS